MYQVIAEKQKEIAEICRRYDVLRLDVFGSAARGRDFEPARSDVDFMVAFSRTYPVELDRYFGMREDLAAILGGKVDLVEEGAIKNPYLKASIDEDRERVYLKGVYET